MAFIWLQDSETVVSCLHQEKQKRERSKGFISENKQEEKLE